MPYASERALEAPYSSERALRRAQARHCHNGGYYLGGRDDTDGDDDARSCLVAVATAV